jgi:hypothetical protein
MYMDLFPFFLFFRYGDFHESYEETVLKKYHWCKLKYLLKLL